MERVEKPDVPLGKVLEWAPRLPIAFLQIVLDVPIGYKPVSTTDARRVFDAACALEGVVIEPVLTANMFAVLVAFVLAGDAVSIMSEVSVRGRVESGQLVAIPIRSSHNLMRCIEIQVMAGRRLPDVAQKFIELLIAELERAV